MFVIGEKYLCKKSDKYVGTTKDKCYTLIAIDTYKDESLLIFNINEIKFAFSHYDFDKYYICDYFCTRKEERNIKLKNIENEGR